MVLPWARFESSDRMNSKPLTFQEYMIIPALPGLGHS